MTEYKRTPLPKQAILPAGCFMLCWMLLIFSPFIGFFIHGKVSSEAFAYAAPFAIFALVSIGIIIFRTKAAYKKLPEIIQEYKQGTIFPPMDAPQSSEPFLATLDKKGKKQIKIGTSGLWYTPASVLRGSYEIAKLNYDLAKMADKGESDFQHISWADIEEWQVHDDADNPDYYRINLKEKQYITILRPRNPELESQILDHVRSLSRTQVRIFCDI